MLYWSEATNNSDFWWSDQGKNNTCFWRGAWPWVSGTNHYQQLSRTLYICQGCFGGHTYQSQWKIWNAWHLVYLGWPKDHSDHGISSFAPLIPQYAQGSQGCSQKAGTLLKWSAREMCQKMCFGGLLQQMDPQESAWLLSSNITCARGYWGCWLPMSYSPKIPLGAQLHWVFSGAVKKYLCDNCDYTFDTLKENMPKALESVSVHTI